VTGRQQSLARAFHALHAPGHPLVLYNAWDVGSAKAVSEAGATAIATGSWSVAAANGFDDGERIPLERVIDIARRIVAAVDLPVTLDFEGGYARRPGDLAANIRAILETGIVGINFEDQQVGVGTLYSIDEQVERISAVRTAADSADVPLFINARTDLFLRNDVATHSKHVDEAIERAVAYAAAGGSGLFVPGLRDEHLIGRVCAESPVAVNVMFHPDLPPLKRLAGLGVARLSHGPRPYREMMAQLTAAARAAMTG
jgi:2-methylisocitrate lyase-like PEP mutase family enzyme